MQRQFMRSAGKYSQTPKTLFKENFRFCETKKSKENRATLYYKNLFSILRVFRNREVPQKISRTIRQNKVDEKRDTSVMHSFLTPETFRNNKRIPSRKFSGRQ